MLVYLRRCTIKFLFTETMFHTGNNRSDFQGAWTSLRSVNTIFPRMDLAQNILQNKVYFSTSNSKTRCISRLFVKRRKAPVASNNCWHGFSDDFPELRFVKTSSHNILEHWILGYYYNCKIFAVLYQWGCARPMTHICRTRVNVLYQCVTLSLFVKLIRISLAFIRGLADPL